MDLVSLFLLLRMTLSLPRDTSAESAGELEVEVVSVKDASDRVAMTFLIQPSQA